MSDADIVLEFMLQGGDEPAALAALDRLVADKDGSEFLKNCAEAALLKEQNLRVHTPQVNPTPRPTLLTSADLASMLSVHRNTVGRLVREGEITSVRVGRLMRFRHEDVESYLDSHRSAR